MPQVTLLGYQIGKSKGKTSNSRIFNFIHRYNNIDAKIFCMEFLLNNLTKNKISTNNIIMNEKCCCDNVITSMTDVNILNCDSEMNFSNIPTTTETQNLANEINDTYLTPTVQPSASSTKAPLVYTKMFDNLLSKIHEEFITNPRIIRLFDAFNYNNGSQMTMQQYDNIIKACVIFWREKNFELLKKDTKMFFNFCIQDYISGKFFVSYKPVIYNCDKIIDDFNDPNYGANGYTQWLGNYIATKKMMGTSGNYGNVYVDGYKFSSVRAMTEGQFFETRGFQVKSRSLGTTFSGVPGTDVTFQWILCEQDTTVHTTTNQLLNGLSQTITTETNALGQSKISTTTKDTNNNIKSMSVTYADGLTYDIVSNIEY